MSRTSSASRAGADGPLAGTRDGGGLRLTRSRIPCDDEHSHAAVRVACCVLRNR